VRLQNGALMPDGWTIPDEDTSRRIVLSLRYGWPFRPSWDCDDGQWHAMKGDLDLTGPNLKAVVTEADDLELMAEVESGTYWATVFVPGEPDPKPLATVLALHRTVGVDTRSKLPRRCLLETPKIYALPSTLAGAACAGAAGPPGRQRLPGPGPAPGPPIRLALSS
jgi:hypothetical protein